MSKRFIINSTCGWNPFFTFYSNTGITSNICAAISHNLECSLSTDYIKSRINSIFPFTVLGSKYLIFHNNSIRKLAVYVGKDTSILDTNNYFNVIRFITHRSIISSYELPTEDNFPNVFTFTDTIGLEYTVTVLEK